MPSVMRRLSALLALLALLMLPLGALADDCTDCFGAGPGDCCAPSCCPCCVHGPLTMSVLAKAQAGPAPAGFTGDPVPVSALSPHLRDVFHVPKRSLV